MATRARPLTEEEEQALEEVGQTHEEGRSIPAPEMVLFTGETALKVRELSELCGIEPQEVIGVALQNLYNTVKEREKAEREGRVTEEKRLEEAAQEPDEPENLDPFRPH